MLQLKHIREEKDAIQQALMKRGLDASDLLDRAIRLDEERRATQTELDSSLARTNTLSKEIGVLFKSGKGDQAQALKDESAGLKETAKALSEKLQEKDAALRDVLSQIPNVPHESVPAGTDESDNEIVFETGTAPELVEGALPHWELADAYDIIDFELGVKVTGAGFPIYKGQGAKLQRALITYFLDKNTAAGYTEMQVPHLVNEASGFGTGQLPDKEGQMYVVGADDLYLIPTAEVPITNMLRDTILREDQFPVCYTGYTPCFRREAGSYGAHVRGLNRLHQFDKVEIVRIEKPEDSYAALEGMVAHVKEILAELQLPYRILRLCGGDLGFTSALTYDFEVYSAAQKRWLEISSVSNFETFQANRLKLRFKDPSNKTRLAHTLNGSALALPRVLAALLENGQSEAGINIPEILRPYTGFDQITKA